VKTLSVCVLLSLLSMAAFSGFSGAQRRAGQPLSVMTAAPSIAATPPSLNTPESAIVLDAPSTRATQGAARGDSHVAANLSTYVALHKAWDDGIPASAAPGLSVCSE
jgi:hypothetical protein